MGWTDWTHGVGRAVTSSIPSGTLRVEQNGYAVKYAGNWYADTNSKHSGGSAALAMDKGARAAFTFTGTAVRWVGLRDRWSGIARVYLDGVSLGEVDTFSNSDQPSVPIYSVADLPYAAHTIVIEATGRKRSGSGGRWIWIDAFDYAAPTQ
jgi:hypothetical protein